MSIRIIRNVPKLISTVLCSVWLLYREFIDNYGDAGILPPTRSFYLEPVYRLVPIFNPFLMAALLVVLLPYFVMPELTFHL